MSQQDVTYKRARNVPRKAIPKHRGRPFQTYINRASTAANRHRTHDAPSTPPTGSHQPRSADTTQPGDDSASKPAHCNRGAPTAEPPLTYRLTTHPKHGNGRTQGSAYGSKT